MLVGDGFDMRVNGRADSRERSSWLRAGGAATRLLSAVPHRYRYDAARILARAVEPVLKRTTLYRTWPTRLDGVRELALYGVMTLMDRQRVPFDPPLRLSGVALLQDDLRHGRGVLLLGLHQSLATLVPRYLHDIGCTPLIVAASPTFPIVGAATSAQALQGSTSLLIRVRSQLRAGGVVCAMLDVGGRESISVETAAGRVAFNHAWMRLAWRCRASIAFVWARVEGKDIAISLSRPAYAPNASADDVIDAVVAHACAHIEQLVVARPPARGRPDRPSRRSRSAEGMRIRGCADE